MQVYTKVVHIVKFTVMRHSMWSNLNACHLHRLKFYALYMCDLAGKSAHARYSMDVQITIWREQFNISVSLSLEGIKKLRLCHALLCQKAFGRLLCDCGVSHDDLDYKWALS